MVTDTDKRLDKDINAGQRVITRAYDLYSLSTQSMMQDVPPSCAAGCPRGPVPPVNP